MSGIKISVIVPVYNTEQYLKRCVDSLVNQTLKEIEIICVNDNSPDNSISILREYERAYPDKVRVIDSEVNLKQGGARNIGIRKSRGQYIGFVDSDDWVRLDMYEKLFNRASEKDGEIIYCDYQTAKSENGPFNPVNRNDLVNWNSETEEIKKSLIIKPQSIWSGIYSRDLFFNNNIFFPENLFYEDNYIVPLLISKSTNISKVNEPLVYYFTGNISVTRSFNNEKFFDRVTTANMMLKESRERELYKYKEEIEFFFIEIFFINTSIGCLRKFFPMKFKELLKIRKKINSLIPDYKKNTYLIKKMNKKIQYKVYVLLLRFFPHALYLLFLPFGIYKKAKIGRQA